MSRDNRSLPIIKHPCNKHDICLFHKKCIKLRNSTKHLNNTTQLLYSINFIYKLTWVLLIEVYLWNKFLDNASIELAVFMLINSLFLPYYVLFDIDGLRYPIMNTWPLYINQTINLLSRGFYIKVLKNTFIWNL